MPKYDPSQVPRAMDTLDIPEFLRSTLTDTLVYWAYRRLCDKKYLPGGLRHTEITMARDVLLDGLAHHWVGAEASQVGVNAQSLIQQRSIDEVPFDDLYYTPNTAGRQHRSHGLDFPTTRKPRSTSVWQESKPQKVRFQDVNASSRGNTVPMSSTSRNTSNLTSRRAAPAPPTSRVAPAPAASRKTYSSARAVPAPHCTRCDDGVPKYY